MAVAVTLGILTRAQHVLVAERPINKPYSGYWEFPGGKIEPGESSLQALQRELFEEIGVQNIRADFLFPHSHTYPERTVNIDIWLVNSFQAEPQPKENQQLRWVNLDELVSLQLLDGMWTLLDKIKFIFSESRTKESMS